MHKLMKNAIILLLMISVLPAAGCSVKMATEIPENSDPAPKVSENAPNAAEEETDTNAVSDPVVDDNDAKEIKEDEGIPGKAETDIEEPDLKEKLKEVSKVNDEEIRFFHQDDFDSDGKEEAFAITGTVTDYDSGIDSQEIIEGVIWFVSDDTCIKLKESEAWGFIGSDRVMKLGSRNFIMFDDVATTAYVTYVWTVSEGKAVESEISRKGEVIQEQDNDSFSIMDSSYDALLDVDGNILGHTWKKYYFYYDEATDKIQEYGGTLIDTETADSLYGKPFANELLLPGDKEKEILYYGNDLVVLNFERPDGEDIDYCHYIYDRNKGCFINDFGEETTDEEPLYGTYLKALCPEMAIYTMPETDN
ncbi:MAG: hypothetical protein IKQ40_03890 [Lachnospiraceae bacterium]|nr:hypothetical protein [Lachnospiraceae bacterium]